MIRLATVFSGIGAPEEALRQLNEDYEIVFACDNGERELEETYDQIIEATENMTYEERLQYVAELYENTNKPNFVKESYFANHQIDDDRWYDDVRFIDGEQYEGLVDVLVGGSPCQSFSNYGKKLGLEDVRGTLFYDYARIIKESKPKIFIYENVENVTKNDNGKTWKVMLDVWMSLGYHIEWAILDSKDYNQPQLRSRLFLIGFRDDIYTKPYSFPTKKELKRKSTDFLEDGPIDDIYYLGKKIS